MPGFGWPGGVQAAGLPAGEGDHEGPREEGGTLDHGAEELGVGWVGGVGNCGVVEFGVGRWGNWRTVCGYHVSDVECWRCRVGSRSKMVYVLVCVCRI